MSNTAVWSASSDALSLQVIDSDAGFWNETGHLMHSLLIRVDRVGQVSVQCDVQAQPLLPAGTLFLPAQTGATYRASLGLSRVILRVSDAFIQQLARDSNSPAPANWHATKPAHDPITEHYASLLMHEKSLGSRISPHFLSAYERLIGLHILRRYAPTANDNERQQGSSLPAALKTKIDEFIRRTLPEPITMEALAAHCAMSHYQLLRLFKRSGTETPQSYVMGQRIALARKLLRESEVGLVDLAAELGFSSQSHFSSSFKTATGHSPRSYRERTDLI